MRSSLIARTGTKKRFFTGVVASSYNPATQQPKNLPRRIHRHREPDLSDRRVVVRVAADLVLRAVALHGVGDVAEEGAGVLVAEAGAEVDGAEAAGGDL